MSDAPSWAAGAGEPGLVSVVLPAYNRAYIVGRAIESVLGQTYPKLEVVVVDDGSTDDTRKVVEAYGPPVRYIHQANAGVSAARNTGLAAARGEFVALLDSDDSWRPWKLAAQIAILAAFHEIGMVWTDMTAVDEKGAVVATRYLRTYYGAYGKTRLEQWLRPLGEVRDMGASVPAELGPAPVWGGDLFSAMLYGNLVHTSTVLLRRERLRRVGGFDVSLRTSGEDYDFHWRTCREGPVALLDVPSVLYRVEAADQLSKPSLHVHMARNALRTLEARLAVDRDRFRLPRRVVRRQLGALHAWLGEELFLEGGMPGSTSHLARGVMLNPGQPRAALLLLFSLLPYPAAAALRRLKQRLAAWRR